MNEISLLDESYEGELISHEEKFSGDYLELEKFMEGLDGTICRTEFQEYAKFNNFNVEGIYLNKGLDLSSSKLKSLWKIKSLMSDLYCNGLYLLQDLGDLEYVGGYLGLRRTNVKSLGKLKRVDKNLVCEGLDSLENLGDLEYVGGGADLRRTSIKSIGKLKKVKGSLDLRGVNVDVQLEAIKRIKEGKLSVKGGVYFGGNIVGIEKLLEEEILLGSLELKGTNVRSLGKLKRVDGSLICEGLDCLRDLGELEYVGGDAYLEGVKIRSLGKLKKVHRGLDCNSLCSLEDLGELEEVGGSLDLRQTSIKSIGKLMKVKGSLDLRGVSVDVQLEVIKRINEGKLSVKRGVTFGGKVDGIEKLLEETVIPGDLDLEGTNVKSLGHIQFILGKLNCSGLKCLEDLGELKHVVSINLVGTSIKVQLHALLLFTYTHKVRYRVDRLYLDDIIYLLNSREILFGEVPLFEKIQDMLWIDLFREKLGNYSEIEDVHLRELRIEIGKVMMGKYDKSIKEYLEKNKDKLNQEIADSIGKDLNEKKGLFKNLFGERLVEEMFSN